MLIREVVPAADTVLARALLQVQHDAYAVEAALIQDDRIPLLHEDLDDLRRGPLRWLVALIDGRVSGAVAWAEKADEFDIDRLIVAPSAHRRGVGLALVREVLRRAGTRRTTVSTGRGKWSRQSPVRTTALCSSQGPRGHPRALDNPLPARPLGECPADGVERVGPDTKRSSQEDPLLVHDDRHPHVDEREQIDGPWVSHVDQHRHLGRRPGGTPPSVSSDGTTGTLHGIG